MIINQLYNKKVLNKLYDLRFFQKKQKMNHIKHLTQDLKSYRM